MTEATPNLDQAVLSRYSEGSKAQEAALCCPVSFDARYLEVLPAEILERDYGCGDPTAYVRPGDIVLDLGSGAGKVCWIAAQITGPEGRVIGVDMNRDMLSLARQHHQAIAARVGYDNVEYRRGMIQDLRLDLDLLEAELGRMPVDSVDAWLQMRQIEERLRTDQPMLPDQSIDVVLSNCVLNLVRPEDKALLFREIYRVVKNGGRVAISDIVADEDVPEEMQQDPDLWSGCISGAYREDLFVEAFVEAGFHGVELVERGDEPWRVVGGIEFRSVTVQAFKGKEGPCLERNQAVVYRGPFSEVHDDDGHAFVRGQRTAVSDKTLRLLTQAPYRDSFLAIEPYDEIPIGDSEPFTRAGNTLRAPRVTKGGGRPAEKGPECCGPSEPCC